MMLGEESIRLWGFPQITSNNHRSKLYKTHTSSRYCMFLFHFLWQEHRYLLDDLHPRGVNPRCLPGQMPIQKASENTGKHSVTNSWEVVSHSSDNVVTMV